MSLGRFVMPTLLLTLAVTAAHAAEDRAVPASGAERPIPTERVVYGPIRSTNPLTRAQIKHLYQEMHDLRQSTFATLAQINTKLQSERDPDFRFELSRQAGEAKRTLEVRNCELSLAIARLDGDAPRIVELELALDQMLHPEKYLRRQKPDASVERAQVQESGAR